MIGTGEFEALAERQQELLQTAYEMGVTMCRR